MISVIRICWDDLVSQSGTPRVRQMFMRSLEINAGRGHRASGFSLIEMLIVVALVIVLASISFISFVPVMKRQRVTNAYNTTLSAMRQARDNAVSQRTSYSVTFSTTVQPNTITVSPTLTGGFQGSQNTVVYQLPTDVTFLAQSGRGSRRSTLVTQRMPPEEQRRFTSARTVQGRMTAQEIVRATGMEAWCTSRVQGIC